jgi:tetratricopeptide (TPR) repeat protein
VKDLVDEMVVLDTGSTDMTVAIAESFGARIGRFDWTGDFSEARNASLSLCTGDWILVLDADEAIDRLDHPVIRKAIEDPANHGYFVTLRDYFRSGAFIGINGAVKPNDGKYHEGSPFSHQYDYQAVRLFRAQKESVFRGRIHELAELYFQEKSLNTPTLDVVIHHYGKTDPARDRAKQLEYTRLAKLEVQAKPLDPMNHYNVIQQGLMVEDWEAVLSSAKAYLTLVKKVPMMVYLGAARACVGLENHKESLQYLDAMLAEQPQHVVALDGKGESLWKLGRVQEAQDHFLRAIQTNPSFTLPFFHLARMLSEQGAHEDARRVLEAGLDQNPKDEVLWGELVGLSARLKDERVAADAWNALQAVPDGGQGLWHQLVVYALLSQDAPQDADHVLKLGLQAFPEHPELQALKTKVGV